MSARASAQRRRSPSADTGGHERTDEATESSSRAQILAPSRNLVLEEPCENPTATLVLGKTLSSVAAYVHGNFITLLTIIYMYI